MCAWRTGQGSIRAGDRTAAGPAGQCEVLHAALIGNGFCCFRPCLPHEAHIGAARELRCVPESPPGLSQSVSAEMRVILDKDDRMGDPGIAEFCIETVENCTAENDMPVRIKH